MKGKGNQKRRKEEKGVTPVDTNVQGRITQKEKNIPESGLVGFPVDWPMSRTFSELWGGHRGEFTPGQHGESKEQMPTQRGDEVVGKKNPLKGKRLFWSVDSGRRKGEEFKSATHRKSTTSI